MNKILITVVTTIITLGITLTVLWKLDVIYLNLSPLDKGKELVKLDELSQLLKLEYPRLGDQLESAYILLDEVSFESEGQIDFYIDQTETELYVEYVQQDIDGEEVDIIEALSLYTEGNPKKILSLGEKFLPIENSFITKDHTVSEYRNEMGRYTATTYTDSYFYELPDQGEYAVIRISHRVTDLIKDSKMDEEPITYTLEASFISEQAFQEEIESEDSSQQASINEEEVNYEEASFDQEIVESEEDENNELNEDSFSEEAIQSNNELIMDPDFLSLASQGQIKGIDIPLSAPIGPTIEDIGQPDWIWGAEGGYLLMYESFNCGFGVGYDYEEYPDETAVGSYYLPINLFYEDIIQYLGEPSDEGYSEVDSGYYLYYELGGYELLVNRSIAEPLTDPFDSIMLSMRY